MFADLKNFICKIFKIKACQCETEDILVLKDEVVEPKVKHCKAHLRFRKSCLDCAEQLIKFFKKG